MKSIEIILAEIQKDIQHIRENQAKGFLEMRGQLNKSEEKAQKQLDNHCPRIRSLEKNVGQINIQEEISEIKKVQAVRISNLTKVIAGLSIGATLLASKIWAHLFSG